MYYYNYSLYTPSNSLFFNLNHSSVPYVLAGNVYYKYATIVGSLYDEYISNISKFSHRDDFSIYPMAVRYADPYNGIYVVERPPFQLDVDFSTSKSYRVRKTPKFLQNQTIWIPWTVSVIQFKNYNKSSYTFSFHILFNDKPISSLEEYLVPAYLPNVDYSGRVCLGQDSLPVTQTISQNPFDIAAIYNMAFNTYFSGWNSDLFPNFTYTNYIKDIAVNRISKNPKAPKSYKDAVPTTSLGHSYSYSNSKFLSNILYTMSNIDLPETIQYITSVKEHYAKDQLLYSSHGHSSPRSVTLSNILKSYYSDKSSIDNIDDYRYSNTSIIQDVLFPFSQRIYNSYNVCIENYDINYSIQSMINNPMIIAKVYEKAVQDYYNDSTSANFLNFDFKDIAHYSKDYQDVSASISN